MKKQIALATALCLTIGLAAGCSSGNTDTAGAEETNTESNGEKTKLTVQSWQYALGNYKGFTEDDDIEAAIEEEFEASHPDIDLEVILTRQEDHYNQLRVDLSAGTAPDVIGIAAGSTLEQFKTQLEPLAPYAEEEWGENWKEKFVADAFTNVEMSGEEIYAFPSAMSVAGTVWYADEQLTAGGVDAMPATWEELIEASSTLRENGSIPMVFGGQDAWENYDMFITIMGSINKDLCNQIFNLEADWNQEDVVKAFEYFQQLYTEGIVQDGAATTTIYNEGYSVWRDDDGYGDASMIFNGSWDLGSLNSSNPYYDVFSKRGIGVSTLPSIEGKDSIAIVAPDVSWAITGSSEVKDAAWEFIRWMVDDMQQAVVDGLGFFSVLQDAPEMTTETTEEYQNVYDTVADIIASGNTVGFREALYTEMSDALFDNLQLLATGGTTPAEAAQAMSDACSSISAQ